MKSIEPDREDYAEIERKYGGLPDDASDEQRAKHRQLAQAQKLIRLYAADERKRLGIEPPQRKD
jgi:hypothetical protein